MPEIGVSIMTNTPTAIKTFLDSFHKDDGPRIRADLFEIEAIETGGTIIGPDRTGNWISTHIYEISLHGIYMSGHSLNEAMMKWERCARRCILGETSRAVA